MILSGHRLKGLSAKCSRALERRLADSTVYLRRAMRTGHLKPIYLPRKTNVQITCAFCQVKLLVKFQFHPNIFLATSEHDTGYISMIPHTHYIAQ